MNKKLELSLREAQILDGQLHVAQVNVTRRRMSKEGLTMEDKVFMEELSELRLKITKFTNKCAAERHTG